MVACRRSEHSFQHERSELLNACDEAIEKIAYVNRG